MRSQLHLTHEPVSHAIPSVDIPFCGRIEIAQFAIGHIRSVIMVFGTTLRLWV